MNKPERNFTLTSIIKKLTGFCPEVQMSQPYIELTNVFQNTSRNHDVSDMFFREFHALYPAYFEVAKLYYTVMLQFCLSHSIKYPAGLLVLFLLALTASIS